jgi:hypothetical protein
MDDTLLSFQDLGKGSGALIREALGLPSCDGVRSPRAKSRPKPVRRPFYSAPKKPPLGLAQRRLLPVRNHKSCPHVAPSEANKR